MLQSFHICEGLLIGRSYKKKVSWISNSKFPGMGVLFHMTPSMMTTGDVVNFGCKSYLKSVKLKTYISMSVIGQITHDR